MVADTPHWLQKLEKRFGAFAIPNLPIVMVGIQVFGLFVLYANAEGIQKMILYPDFVIAGQVWRLITFMAVPQVTNIIFALFVLWFLYFIVSTLEAEWGDFFTTVYILIAWLVSVGFSFVFNVPIWGMSEITSSLFLAVAVLFPEHEILLYCIIPVKMKWLAWLAVAYLIFRLITGSNLDRLYLMLIYMNYLLFFGSYHIGQFQALQRRRKFQNTRR